jgi:hypothetical protein
MVWLSATVRPRRQDSHSYLQPFNRFLCGNITARSTRSTRSTSTQSHFLDPSISRTIPQQETAWLRFVLPVGSEQEMLGRLHSPPLQRITVNQWHTVTTVTLDSTWRYLYFTCPSGNSIRIGTCTPVHRPTSRVLFAVLYCRIASDVNLREIQTHCWTFCDVTPCSSVELYRRFGRTDSRARLVRVWAP